MSSSAIPTKDSSDQSSSPSEPAVLIPYLAAIAVQAPLLFLYFKELWSHKPHYQFAPFAVAVVIYLAVVRWPRETRMPFHQSLFSNVLLFLGIVVGLTNCLFIEPWFAAISCYLFAASLLARTFNSNSGKSLFAISLPLLVCIVPPGRGDMWIITNLQRISAYFTSQLLDVVGYGHHMPGTVIKAPGTEGFGIAEACSGVQSFFTLLFVAVVFCVWNRRPWFRSSILVLSTVFWAILMNTVRIFTIPIVDRVSNSNWDLSQGISHALLGYATLAIGILLVFSTDQLLLFLFGPVDPDSVHENTGLARWISQGWNRNIAGGGSETQRSRKRISAITGTIILATGVLMVLGGGWQLIDVGRSLFSENKQIQFFQSIIAVPYKPTDLPQEIDGWKLDENNPYISEDRKHGSDLGLHSDTWNYVAPRQFRMVISADQTFPGWHELSACYINSGWQLVNRKRVTLPSEDGTDEGWGYVQAEFTKNTGEKAFLLFSLFDAFGEPYDPPKQWGTLEYFVSGIRNRMSQRIRAQLFRGETFQTQAFVATFAEITDEQKQEITDRYLKLREIMRTKFIERRAMSSGEGS